MRVLDLFSGIGGFSLAAHWAGMQTAAFCEIEPFCQKVLQKNFPGIPIYDDVKKLTREQLEKDGVISDERPIGLICGGVPCQPFSVAGKQRGINDERYLWPEMYRIIREIRPTWVLIENVTGFVKLALDLVIDDLENEGYEARTFIIPASAVGAPHRRDRVWIVAHASSGQRQSGAKESKTLREVLEDGRKYDHSDGSSQTFTRTTLADTNSQRRDNRSNNRQGRQVYSDEKRNATTPSEIGEKLQSQPRSDGKDVANADSKGLQRWSKSGDVDQEGEGYHQHAQRFGQLYDRDDRFSQPRLGGDAYGLPAGLDGHRWPAGLGQEQYEWEPPRVATGIKHRKDRLQALGNSIVPQVAYQILKAIMEMEVEHNEPASGICTD